MAMTEYKAKRDACRQKIASKYEILGFISSGTYGRVYKAKSKSKYVERTPVEANVLCIHGWIISELGSSNTPQHFTSLLGSTEHRDDGKEYAIKKFKPDKEGEAATYTGISQSACREIAVSYGSSYLLLERILCRIIRTHSPFVLPLSSNSSAENCITKTLLDLRRCCWKTSRSIWCLSTQNTIFW